MRYCAAGGESSETHATIELQFFSKNASKNFCGPGSSPGKSGLFYKNIIQIFYVFSIFSGLSILFIFIKFTGIKTKGTLNLHFIPRNFSGNQRKNPIHEYAYLIKGYEIPVIMQNDAKICTMDIIFEKKIQYVNTSEMSQTKQTNLTPELYSKLNIKIST